MFISFIFLFCFFPLLIILFILFILGFSRQNLRDQAARLEKQQGITNNGVNQTLKSPSEVNSRQFEESEILNLSNSEENYGNSSQEADLHMSSSSQIPPTLCWPEVRK